MTTWTPDTPPPCPLCGTVLTERTEPDGGEEGGTLYAYLCPGCRWEDAGSYDYTRLTVATAPWTRDLWAEVERTREERDTLAARVRELEAPGECQSVHKLRAALAALVEAVADEGPVTATVAPAWDRACAVLSAGWREGQEVTR